MLDVSRFFGNAYFHQKIDDGKAHEKNYFHISAPDFTQDLAIGFSNGYTNHDDAKWEIVAGGRAGTEFVIRQGNCCVPSLAVYRPFENRTEWERLRNNFAVQMNDGNISVYSANSDGTIGDRILEWNDETIVKSHYNTLTVTGGFGGTGTARIRGICN